MNDVLLLVDLVNALDYFKFGAVWSGSANPFENPNLIECLHNFHNNRGWLTNHEVRKREQGR